MHKFRLLLLAAALFAVPTGLSAHRIAHAQASKSTQPTDMILSVPYFDQYQRQSTENFDCGPTSVAMILEYFYAVPSGMSNGDLITKVRNATGNTGGADTGFADLENAISAYGLPYSEISNSLAPQPAAQMQAMQQATDNGQPVIALIHGADLGRGQQYGDHWVVVTGFSSDGQTVYLNDPDDQAPRWSGWIQGGQIKLPLSIFQQAAYDAPYGPYGIIVSPPTWNL
jgi:hypothetical protein